MAAVNMAAPGVVARSGHLKGEDYSHFYVLGRLAHEGRVAWLYDTAAQARYLPTAIPGAPTTYFIPVYGPQVALFFQPFASVPYLPSLALWTIASAALYLGSCFGVWRRLERLRPYRTEVAILAIGSPALWQLILHGQNSAVAVASLTGGWLCLRARRHVLAGLALGLRFYKPQLALAAVVAQALTGRWVVVASMAACTLIQLASCISRSDRARSSSTSACSGALPRSCR